MGDNKISVVGAQNKLREITNDYGYYMFAVLVGIIGLVVFPFVGGWADLGFTFPQSNAGWIVWGITRGTVLILNILIFHAFVKQAKVNVKDNQNYLRAVELYRQQSGYKRKLLTLAQFNRQQYGTKLTTLTITSAATLFSFGQAILTFEWMTFLSYLITIVMALFFGWLTMRRYEQYYTSDYLEIAMIQEEQRQAQQNKLKNGNQDQVANEQETNEENDLSTLEQEDSVDDSTATC